MWIVFLSAAFEPGDDEVGLLIVSGVFCIAGIVQLVNHALVSRLGVSNWQRLPLHLAFLVSFAGLLFVTKHWTAQEVREHNFYVFLVMVMGGALLTVAGWLFRWLGIGMREDVYERRNVAAALALSGAVVGAMLIFIGSNVGEGPSFWNNVFTVTLGMAAWFALWLVLELSARVAASVTEDRDLASGIRLGGFLMASGLILARALAGNWESVTSTVRDFGHDSWPALLLLMVAAMGEWNLRPNSSRPFPSWKTSGLLVALVYLAVASGWVWHLGWWEGAPR